MIEYDGNSCWYTLYTTPAIPVAALTKDHDLQLTLSISTQSNNFNETNVFATVALPENGLFVDPVPDLVNQSTASVVTDVETLTDRKSTV